MSTGNITFYKISLDPKNEEFIGLANSVGWTQAEVARQLHMSTGAVNQIYTGKTSPAGATLNLLKLVIAKNKPDALKLSDAPSNVMEPWASDLLAELRRMAPAEREKVLLAIRQLLKAFQAAQVRTVYKVKRYK